MKHLQSALGYLMVMFALTGDDWYYRGMAGLEIIMDAMHKYGDHIQRIEIITAEEFAAAVAPPSKGWLN